MQRPQALIAGAGPAGLTAALELLRQSDVLPIIIEPDRQVGGISKTINYRGNRMDLGGHRFFSKSDWVMKWWQEILPVSNGGDGGSGGPIDLAYQRRMHSFTPLNVSEGESDAVLLIRSRLSRIYHRRRFFDYPLRLNVATVGQMGFIETVRIALSYGRAQLRRGRAEASLEDFFISRFGDRLYRTFFKDYTEKVWGVPCTHISAEWGAQRIKGLSIRRAMAHALSKRFNRKDGAAQKNTETSLIERFLYPKFGPGQMWEEVARHVVRRGGRIELRQRVVGIESRGESIVAVTVQDETNSMVRRIPCDYLISTVPVSHLTAMLQPADEYVRRVAEQLPYRDFMTAGLLVRNMKMLKGGSITDSGMPADNWIYVQEPDVKLGRIQIFNNWSPAMVADPSTIWLGLEYFCQEGDELWTMTDADFLLFAARELETIGMIDSDQVLDGTVVRVPKAYPAYFGEYRHFDTVRAFLDTFSNLYPVGRNGMHRYNNQDHSMLAAAGAVSAIVHGNAGKAAIWSINAEDDYHEEVAER